MIAMMIPACDDIEPILPLSLLAVQRSVFTDSYAFLRCRFIRLPQQNMSPGIERIIAQQMIFSNMYRNIGNIKEHFPNRLIFWKYF
jgi:hypothetical protein